MNLLCSAYPEKKHDETTLKLYYELLADIPARVLEQAARMHIRSSVWLPRIADLRHTAARIAGTRDFASLPARASHEDHLAAQAIALEQGFYRQGCLDTKAWEELADQFQRAGRPQPAEHTRQKFTRLKTIQSSRLAAQTRVEMPPTKQPIAPDL